MKNKRTKPKACPKRSRRVFVALSGGVDSSVAAWLLKKQGYEVIGVFMKCWDDSSEMRSPRECPAQYDYEDARRVAQKLNIPFYSWNFVKEYKKEVFDYFIKEYQGGRTPNPDVVCNQKIKFNLFLKRARKLGAEYMATGHYVKNIKYQISNIKYIYKLFQARDKNKDQSYFLWTLTQKQLSYCLFPLGEYTKKEVRGLAKKYHLPTAQKPDSQGVCFIGEVKLKEFLKNWIRSRQGKIMTLDGKMIGEHEGIYYYTIGQRQGLGIGGGKPYYVVKKDSKKNILWVTNNPLDKTLYHKEAWLKKIHPAYDGINWISGIAPALPLKCFCKIRYRQPEVACLITQKESQWKVKFSQPQRAVSPGQSAVFYSKKGEMLGGGIIEK